jgi:hypothetical protein
MPDTIPYFSILPYLFFGFLGFVPYAHTICRGECYEWKMLGYERGWDVRGAV